MQKEKTQSKYFPTECADATLHIVVIRAGFFGRPKRVIIDKWYVSEYNKHTEERIRRHMQHEGLKEPFEVVRV